MDTNIHLYKAAELILKAADKHLLKKAVFSKPADTTLLKAVMSEKCISGKNVLQAEFFHKDNKVTHKNFALDSFGTAELYDFALGYSQINILCLGADAEYKCSSSGKTALINEKKLERSLGESEAASTPIAENNREKKHILTGNEPFLKLLGVSDENGRVFDKKQSKFKQINRFLEIIRDCEDKLPRESIRICDLCCGKSYLSFAAYHYFAVIKQMKVDMTGVDLKKDVIEYCSKVAERLGFDGLQFVCGDVNEYVSDVPPALVISLHACDIATDIVLCKAAEWQADVILSTPCCHHELNHNIDCEALGFITKHSMLRQKLCDAATDALRLLRLEAEGYTTSTVELIDPNETPKNVMLRAFRNKQFSKDSKEAQRAKKAYLDARSFLCGEQDTSKFHF